MTKVTVALIKLQIIYSQGHQCARWRLSTTWLITVNEVEKQGQCSVITNGLSLLDKRWKFSHGQMKTKLSA